MKNFLQLTGKYTIKKGQNIIQAKNNLTVFGALQIARLLKRDIIFPKYGNDYYDKIISYNGQLKKISIKNGSSIDCFNGDNSNVSNQSKEKNDLKKIIDGNKASFDILQFKDNKNSSYPKDGGFEIYLKQQLNISRIGIIAQQIRKENEYGYYDTYAAQDVSELVFFVKPCGYKLIYTEKNNNENNTVQWTQGNIDGTDISLCYSSGNYLKVYNPYQPTINGRPYYINYRIENNTNYVYCLYYDVNLNNWAIAPATFNSIQYEKKSNENIASNFVVNINYSARISLDTQNLSAQNKKDDIEIEVIGANLSSQFHYYNLLLTKGVDDWMQPSNRLYNYSVESSNVNGYINLLSDIGLNYSDTATQRKIQYSSNSTDFDAMVAYNCFSFEHLSTVNDLYGIENNTYNSQQNLIGFIPYIQAIRFQRLKGYNNNTYQLKIYQIDLFSPCKIPYNPCYIALKLQDSNEWYGDYVDSIQRKGNNTIVFTKSLSADMSLKNIQQIGLFGNFSGHLDGTTPMQIIAKDINCFSKATFENIWNKQRDEQVIISYELTIGDQNL